MNQEMPILRVLGASCLIASVAIGAGMLALPIATGMAGFGPASVALVVAFIYMLYCLFLVLEATMVSPDGSNFISMVKRSLGPWGQIVAWAAYLLLLYSAVAAYISGGGGLLSHVVNEHFPHTLSAGWATTIFVCFAVILVFSGTLLVDYCNRLLTFGLVASFAALLFFVMPSAKLSLLTHQAPKYVWSAIPLILLSYTSHLMVPSLRTYLHNSRPALLWSLVIGSIIPFLMYMVWEFTVLGILPVGGMHGLSGVVHSHHQVADLVAFLSWYLHAWQLTDIVSYFSFFALITSFVGASLSLCHFLVDGLHLAKHRGGQWLGVFLTFIPPMVFAWSFPRGFTVALSYAGVFVAILFCLFPAMMVWHSRYRLAESRPFRCWGGKLTLLLVMLLAVGVIVLQILSTMGWLPGSEGL